MKHGYSIVLLLGSLSGNILAAPFPQHVQAAEKEFCKSDSLFVGDPDSGNPDQRYAVKCVRGESSKEQVILITCGPERCARPLLTPSSPENWRHRLAKYHAKYPN